MNNSKKQSGSGSLGALRLGAWAVGLSAAALLVACASAEAPKPTAATSPAIVPAVPTLVIGCSVVNAAPTPRESALLTTITADDHVRGPSAAAVTLMYYCDFQSAECELFNRVLDRLVALHPEDLQVVMRPFPIPASVVAGLDKSELAARAAMAADEQGKFWEMRDDLHQRYTEWTRLSAADFESWIKAEAAALNLDAPRFEADLQSPGITDQARGLYESAVSAGITSVPTVFINGRLQDRAALSYDGIESTIGLIALGSKQFRACPPFDVDSSRQYIATLHTAKGDIVINLLAGQAPLAVNSFVFLARKGWFDGVTFHRVIPGFVAQAGDPSGTGRGGPGYYFNNDVRSDLLFDKPGVVGMANSGPDTNGSQFFITYAPEPQLDGSYTVFGQVVSGMDVAESLTPRDPQASTDLPPGDKILGVTIEER